ncbi:hypothetical protein GCM10010400_01540 [Streptomyces aculeolatus]
MDECTVVEEFLDGASICRTRILITSGRADPPQRAGSVNDGYELQRTDAKGEGVFATRSFQLGETVMVGVIDRELDENHSHASQIDEKRFVLHGGLVPKVNHSCEPNCGIHLNASGAHDLIARWSITAGQEITFDYAMRNYSVSHFAAHCRCGTPCCRDRITGWKGLPAERKADYRGFVAPYLIEIDHQLAGTSTDLTGKGSELP